MEGNNIITDAAALWSSLQSKGGVDTGYYDKEILNSEDDALNLYKILGIVKSSENLEDDLAANAVTTEAFLIALLAALHPYSQMMSELCSFFEKYQVRYAKDNLKLKFDFGTAASELPFNLEHFREVLAEFELVRKNVSDVVLNSLKLWKLRNIFYKDDVLVSNPAASNWLKGYSYGKNTTEAGSFENPDISVPQTGHALLDLQLQRAMEVWKTFVTICRSNGPTVKVFRDKVRREKGTLSDRDAHIFSDVRLVAHAETDFWPGSFLMGFFGKLETMAMLPADEKAATYDKLAKKLTKFFDALPVATFSKVQLTKKLSELLSLPVWKHRYELYAAWILTTIDKALEKHHTELHHEKGTLALLFKPTHIMTIKTATWAFYL